MQKADLGIILAAGGSTRMGSSKALLTVDGDPLVSVHIHALRPFVQQVVVVVGAESTAVRNACPSWVAVVHNPDWARTHTADSLRLALLAFPDARTSLVTPVDTPWALPETCRKLLDHPAPTVPHSAGGTDGHPVLIDASISARVRNQAPTGGLRTLLDGAHRVPVGDPLVAKDFDTANHWQSIRLALEARRSG